MKIAKDTAVTLSYQLASATGQPIDTGRAPLVYLHGGYDNLFPKVEAALEGLEPGASVKLELSPADAFGARDEALAVAIPKSEFPPGVKVGGVIERRDAEGRERPYRVVKIKGPQVLIDGNHQLAGETLRFTATVQDVRPATAEEIAHRHVHGEHGHHH